MRRTTGLLRLARSRWSRTSQADTDTRTSGLYRDEVLPHLYGTPQTDSPQGAVAGSHNQSDAGSGGNSSASQPRGDRPLGVEGQQLGGDPSVDSVCRARVAGTGSRDYPPPDREGDCPGSGVGEQEAVRGAGKPTRWLGASHIESTWYGFSENHRTLRQGVGDD